jgi:acyl-homoserine-lactone acylase
MKKSLTLLPVLILLFAWSCNSDINQKDTEILWDNYGVPHIYAPDASEMYYAFGRAQMHSHTNLILKLYAQARGKSAS